MLQAALSETLGGKALDRHLDADEAIVMGAGLFAANLSTSFRLRKFGLVDTATFGIKLTIDDIKLGEPPLAAAAGDGDSSAPAADPGFLKVRPLLPAGKKLPVKRSVSFTNLTADPIKFTLSYNESAPHGLPPGTKGAVLGEFEVTGIPTVISRYNTSGTVSLRFEADYAGVLDLATVEAVVEYTVMEEKIVEVVEPVVVVNGTNSTSGENSTLTVDGGGGEGEEKEGGEKSEGEEGENEKSEDASADKEEPAADADAAAEDAGAAANATTGGDDAVNATKASVKRITVPKKRTARVVLNVTGPGFVYRGLAGADLEASRKVRAHPTLYPHH